MSVNTRGLVEGYIEEEEEEEVQKGEVSVGGLCHAILFLQITEEVVEQTSDCPVRLPHCICIPIFVYIYIC